MQLILASASPRRRELLESMGVEFEVQAADIDESRLSEEAAQDYVVRLARSKASAVGSQCDAEECAILAADTIVVQGDTVFGKPKNFEHAQQIWHSLSLAKHQVMTAVCLAVRDRLNVKLSVTDVEFGVVGAGQMKTYWESGEPKDKAGAYAIQGLASAWVKCIHGSYSNVVGLPLREVNELLRTIDKNWL